MAIVLAAYREQAVIRDTVRSLAAQDYPAPVQVVVVADDDETAAEAGETDAVVLCSAERQGKSAALNRGIAACTAPIIVLMDANVRLAPDCLRTMVRHFTDPTIGAVAGEKRVVDPAGAQNGYWRFESWLKRHESATGSTIGLVGELSAIRCSSFTPLPVDVAVDDLWLALDIIATGQRIVYEPDAYALEQASPDLRSEWERRTRVVAGALDVLWRRRGMLIPRADGIAGQLWGHRLIRMSIGPLAHLALLVVSAAYIRHSWLARLFLAGHVWAGTALVLGVGGRQLPAAAALPGQVLFLQMVALGGMFRYFRGDRPAIWHKPERQNLPAASLGDGPPNKAL